LLGHIVPGKGSPDFYSLTLLDFILGSGGFRSMLPQEIRNKRGLAYSAGSFYAARAQYGVLDAYAMTGSASTAEVVTLFRMIIKSLREHPVSEGELAWAKKSIGNRFIFSLESPEQIAYQQMMLESEGLPHDFIDTFQEKIERVRIQDIQAAADKYLVPERARILIVGDEAGILPRLAGFGEITHIDWKK
jgi:predicted Zn-dependent peptidase